MIQKIITDKEQLSIKCIETTNAVEISEDLLDTAEHHKAECVGLAANQIGYHERVIVVMIDGEFKAIVNPRYILKYGGFKSMVESCLSFPGQSVKKRRHKRIKISYFDPVKNIVVESKFKGFEARIIQHEIDHLNVVLI